jgi:hypothetical protein
LVRKTALWQGGEVQSRPAAEVDGGGPIRAAAVDRKCRGGEQCSPALNYPLLLKFLQGRCRTRLFSR